MRIAKYAKKAGKEVIEKTDYLNYLREDKETFDDRKENLNELLRS